MRFAIELTGIPIAVSTMYAETAAKYRGFLTGRAGLFSVAAAPEEIESERSLVSDYLGEQEAGVRPDADLEDQAVYHKIAERLPEHDATLFHGSSLAVGGKGYVFAAASGVGKSTHTRLWRRCFGERVAMINDDRPILRCTESGVWIGGSPWQGKHDIGNNLTVPLAAICFLRRGPANRIAPLSAEEAYPLILRQCYPCDEEEHAQRQLGLVERIAGSVSLYQLECNMDLEAAWVACAGMRALDEEARK